MKRNARLCLTTLVFAVLILPSAAVFADVLACDGFAYRAGDNLGGQGSAATDGWAGPWLGPAGTATIAAGGLAYPALPAIPHYAAMGANTSGRATRVLDTSAGGPFGRAGLLREGRVGADGMTLYFSFIQQVSAVPGAPPNNLRYYAVELTRGDGNYQRCLLIGHDDVAAVPHYVVRSPSNEPADLSTPNHPDLKCAPLGKEDTEVNFYLVKFTFRADGDRADVYRNPDPAAEPATPTATLACNDLSFDRVSLARFIGANPVHRVGEVHFGSSTPRKASSATRKSPAMAPRLCSRIGRRRSNTTISTKWISPGATCVRSRRGHSTISTPSICPTGGSG